MNKQRYTYLMFPSFPDGPFPLPLLPPRPVSHRRSVRSSAIRSSSCCLRFSLWPAMRSPIGSPSCRWRASNPRGLGLAKPASPLPPHEEHSAKDGSSRECARQQGWPKLVAGNSLGRSSFPRPLFGETGRALCSKTRLSRVVECRWAEGAGV
jgi:hypothetical protein